MNSLRGYIPAMAINHPDDFLVDVGPWEFETIEDLLSLNWVKKWFEREYFKDWSLEQCGQNLMLIKKDKSSWFVIGFLKNKVDFLPEVDQNMFNGKI